mgnify:CR=1 FL=1
MAILRCLQLGYALKQGIPYIVLFGESEVEEGVVRVKDLDAGSEEVVPLVREAQGSSRMLEWLAG